MHWFKKIRTVLNRNQHTSTIVFCCHHLESELITSRLGSSSAGTFMGKRCISGETGNRNVRVVITGNDAGFYTTVFKNRAASLVNTEIIFFSTTGCMQPSVSPGDVVTSHIPFSWKFSNPDSLFCTILAGTTSRSVSSRGIKKCINSCRFQHWHGSVVTCRTGDLSKNIVPLPESAPRIDCADMYSGYAARICCKTGIPFLILKGISHITGREHEIDSVQSNMRAVIHGSYLILDYLDSGKIIPEWLYSCSETNTDSTFVQMA